MKRKNRRNCGNKTRSLIRHIKIQYRLLAVFLLISLLPTICIGMYAYRVYTRSINSKISESALQTVRSLNTNMTIELEKFKITARRFRLRTPFKTVCSKLRPGRIFQGIWCSPSVICPLIFHFSPFI